MNSYQQSLYRHFMDNVVSEKEVDGRLKLKEFDTNLELVKVDNNGNYDIAKNEKVIARYRSEGLIF